MLVEQEDVAAPLEDGVCGAQTGETAADDDDLGHGVYTWLVVSGEVREVRVFVLGPVAFHRRWLACDSGLHNPLPKRSAAQCIPTNRSEVRTCNDARDMKGIKARSEIKDAWQLIQTDFKLECFHIHCGSAPDDQW